MTEENEPEAKHLRIFLPPSSTQEKREEKQVVDNGQQDAM